MQQVSYLPMYNFSNGAIMIIIFAIVCIALVSALFLMMRGSSRKKENKEGEEQ